MNDTLRRRETRREVGRNVIREKERKEESERGRNEERKGGRAEGRKEDKRTRGPDGGAEQRTQCSAVLHHEIKGKSSLANAPSSVARNT
jgi:hypothetical protein